MKVYTKTGDRGETGLWGGTRVLKSDARVAAYGDVDELNCALGAALSVLPKAALELGPRLSRLQQELFLLGSILSGVDASIPAEAVRRLEEEIDAMTAELPPLSRFILPDGCPAAAALHVARAVCRRAERSVVAVKPDLPAIVYLNRLSDHLFTAARWVNLKAGLGETPWAGLPQGAR
ncbi:MAG: cob(I)yrinic acid a,c-diamide adenosyltransferase [Elusimicrobia bacterium]|nr:cob(I)yrinic acid a,c-diamide adenosyltransferase [Elusimicrobiota bacterium]MDE2236941.1 cob(I)yrinic acid a,c-diamide adenosyltransferase [Elusimicrobiota bacterium]MDE2425105.1 cob(I)yrinic acid a,c-diamide adenosyltransferase [Elusimicrobiota bacterium]